MRRTAKRAGFWRWSILLVVATVVGCGSSDDNTSSRAGLLERCSGTYQCDLLDGTTLSVPLARNAQSCVLGESIILEEAGRVRLSDEPEVAGLTWSGDAATFSICEGSECISCALPSESSAPTGGKCTGSPRACSSLGAGTCTLDGCSFSSRVLWNGDIEFECSGSARSCQNYSSKGLCERQTGCGWK